MLAERKRLLLQGKDYYSSNRSPFSFLLLFSFCGNCGKLKESVSVGHFRYGKGNGAVACPGIFLILEVEYFPASDACLV